MKSSVMAENPSCGNVAALSAALVVGFCLAAVLLAPVAWAAQGQGVQALAGGASLGVQATQAGHYTDAKTESEKNDSIGSANAITLNKYVYGSFSKSDDHDFFKVKAPKTGVYTLSFVGDTVGGSGSWRIRVYDADRKEVLSVGYGAGDLSRADWTVELPAGTAYIEVCNNWSLKLSTAYHMRLASSSFKFSDTTSYSGFKSISHDEREENGTIETSNLLKLGSYAYGDYSSSDDHDFYVVKAPARGVYTLSFVGDTVGGSGSWRIRVYDADRKEVLSVGYGAGDLSRADWTVELPAGTAYIEVCNNWSLKLSTAYHVRLKGELASSARVTGVSSKTYNGKAQTQSKLAVKIGGKTLKKNTDYTVSYKKNTNAGTATITIKGKGGYQGTITKTFRIAKAKASKFAVSKVAAKRYQRGKAIKPAPTVKFNGKKLKKGKDYTLSYKNNKKRGTAKIVIKGKGNFTGSKTVKFKIR